MDKQDFYNKFKEELNIRYESAASKRDRTACQYQRGLADGIDITEGIFDRLWREFEKKNDK